MADISPEWNWKQFYAVLADTNATAVYTCPATGFSCALVQWVTVSDDAADARTITLTWVDSSASVTVTLNFQAAVAANTAFEREFKPLVLQPGDSLRATASAAGMHVTGSVIEVSGRYRG